MIPFNSKTFDYAKLHKNHDICKQIAKNMKKARSEMQKWGKHSFATQRLNAFAYVSFDARISE